MSSSHKVLDPSSCHIDSCTHHLHSWRPFLIDFDRPAGGGIGIVHHQPYHTIKRPCRFDRATSLPPFDFIDLSLIDDYKPIPGAGAVVASYNKLHGKLRLLDRKRRRCGSRSVSWRSIDRSRTRRCCLAGATCSDFPVAVGTDSSGELFGNVANWGSDSSGELFGNVY